MCSVLQASHCTTNEPAHVKPSSYSSPLHAQARIQLPLCKSCVLCKAALQPAILNRELLPSGPELARESLSDPKAKLCAKRKKANHGIA